MTLGASDVTESAPEQHVSGKQPLPSVPVLGSELPPGYKEWTGSRSCVTLEQAAAFKHAARCGGCKEFVEMTSEHWFHRKCKVGSHGSACTGRAWRYCHNCSRAAHRRANERASAKLTDEKRKIRSEQTMRYAKTERGKEVRSRAYAKYRKSDKGRATIRRFRVNIRAARLHLKHMLSIEGCCTWEHGCSVATRDCDIHHEKPDEIWKDGKRRKRERISHILNWKDLGHELERNTDDEGVLLLRLLCPTHHAALSLHPEPRANAIPIIKQRWRIVAELKVARRKCEYENCAHPLDECTDIYLSPLFHLDHIFTKHDSDAPMDQRKVMDVSQMIGKTAWYTLDELVAEVAKCRLVHPDCHRIITRQQFADGLITKPPSFEEDERCIEAEDEDDENNASDMEIEPAAKRPKLSDD